MAQGPTERAQRFPVHWLVEASWVEKGVRVTRRGTVRDVGDHGVYFQLDGAPPKGAPIDLEVRLPVEGLPGGAAAMRTTGTVVRVEPQPAMLFGVAAAVDGFRLDFSPIKPQRRSRRMLWRTPVAAMWVDRDGKNRHVAGESEVVNAHGGLIRLPLQTVPQGPLQVMQMRTRELQPARVVWREAIPGGREIRLGVELSRPSESFWGVRIPFRPPVQ